jgi:hypothetical protein
MELGIRLSSVKTSEFHREGGVEPPPPRYATDVNNTWYYTPTSQCAFEAWHGGERNTGTAVPLPRTRKRPNEKSVASTVHLI